MTRFDRLGQPVANAGGFEFSFVEMLVERAEHDQLSVGESRIGFDLAGDRQTVHPRHQEIQKHKLPHSLYHALARPSA